MGIQEPTGLLALPRTGREIQSSPWIQNEGVQVMAVLGASDTRIQDASWSPNAYTSLW